MQRLNAQPRQDRTVEEITNLLKSPAIRTRAGCELLRADLSVQEDISLDLVNGSVSRVMGGDIHGTCGLTLTREFTWATALFRPYIYIQDANYDYLDTKWYLGAYSMTTPVTDAESPEYVVNGYDRLYLLDREIGDTYEVAAGTSYVTAMNTVITNAGLTGALIDSSLSAKTLPKAMVWPLIPASNKSNKPATWRSVFNDLAHALGYNKVWADQAGLFRAEPFVHPRDRPIEFTFSADEIKTIVGRKRTLTYDLFKIPTRWIFVQSNRPTGSATPTEGDGIYTYNLPATHPASATNRGGLVWPKVIRLDAADQAALVAQGNRIVTDDTNISKIFKVTTGPFPAAGHFDIYTYIDLAMGGTRRVQATRWELNLDGSDMTWTWEEVV